jgi:hypothetical protein
MSFEKLLNEFIHSLVSSGLYKDKSSALENIVVDYIERKKQYYESIVHTFENKYSADFSKFTESIKNKADTELEDDWMDWKGSIEMKDAWQAVLNKVLNNEKIEHRKYSFHS